MGRARSRGTSRPTGAVLTLVLAVIAGAIVSGGGSQAAAETADEAEQRAHQAAEAVSALQGEVDAARERYEVALQEVAGSISVATTSEQQADEAVLAEQRAASERTAALRALTQSGGTLGMVDTVLSAKSPGELVAQWQLGSRCWRCCPIDLRRAAQSLTGRSHALCGRTRGRSRQWRRPAT